ncbi:MAG: cupin domain-containing protein [Rhizobiaceae bacterium]|nr:cupin domain-containing protein [Rhizobiaceae bacterium]
MTMHQTIEPEPAGVALGAPRSFLSFTARILGDGHATGGLHAVELNLPSGEASPWHVHHEEDEWFYVSEGEIEAIVGDTRVRLGAGDFAFGPRDIPHGFRVTSKTPARLLLITVGGRFSDFIAENSEPAVEGVTPEPREPDLAKLAASAQRFGQEILGPLPE